MPPVGGGGEEDDDFLSLLGDRVLRLRTPPPEEEEVSIIYIVVEFPGDVRVIIYVLLSLSIHAYRSWHWASSEVQSRHTLGRHGLPSTMGVLMLLALWDLILMSS